MKRRGFLATLLGLVAAPAAAKLPKPVEPVFVGIARPHSNHIEWLRIPELRATPIDGGATLTGSEESLSVFSGHRWRDDEIRALQHEANRRASLELNKLRGKPWA